MPKLVLEIPHSVGQEEATRRLKVRFAAALSQHRELVSDFHEAWNDHTFSFGFQTLGISVSGAVAVGQDQVQLNVKLPIAAMLFKRAIEERIRQEVAALLH